MPARDAERSEQKGGKPMPTHEDTIIAEWLEAHGHGELAPSKRRKR